MIIVDVGNTTIHFAWERKRKIRKHFKLETQKATSASIRKVLLSTFDKDIVVCSVVPAITKLFKKKLPNGKKVYIVGQNIKVPIKSFYDKRTIGMDRLVAAFAAKVFYPSTRLVIDFGTAITFDFLSKNNDYQGGLILPGIGSTLKVFSGCALLPYKINKKRKQHLVPRDTHESINQGVDEGFSCMVNGMVEKYRKKLKFKKTDKIVITGGEAETIMKYLKFTNIYDKNLILNGLVALRCLTSES
ncbi:MAG: type III pantothenate kinase [Candidatus Omnitrophica bacterium]|nr:type III pantothenate kinase [Candidatus Omnitrophota bacterium]